MRIQDVIDALELFAPLPLQEEYDNSGLQVGLTEADVSGALLCLDVTEQIIDEAIQNDCNLIVAHHPLIFHRLSHITDENYVQRTVMRAIQNGITVVAMHTNLDNSVNGVNYRMADRIHLQQIQLLQERNWNGKPYGSGVIGTLLEPMDAKEFIQMVKEQFHADSVSSNELLLHPISKVAICGGAGSFLLKDAIAAGADAFITGEMHYHEYFGHEQEIQIAVVGHYESEQFTIELLRDVLKKHCPQLRTHITTINTNPICYH